MKKITTCKHDWHFVDGTDRLRCSRCGLETGPRTPDQLMQDLLNDVATMGSAWSQDGKRIDPMDVYTIPTEKLYAFSNISPNYHIALSNGLGEVCRLDFNGPELVFTGDADKGAQVFIDWVAQLFLGRLEQERETVRQACAREAELQGCHMVADAILKGGKA